MIWLVIGAVAPSFLIALAAGFMVRRLAPHIGLVDLPGGRKVHGSVTPLGGGLAIWLGVVGAFALGQVTLNRWTPEPATSAAGSAKMPQGPVELALSELDSLAGPHVAGLRPAPATCGLCWPQPPP